MESMLLKCFQAFFVAKTRKILEDIKILYIIRYKDKGINVTLMFSAFCVAQTRKTLEDIKMLYIETSTKASMFL